MRTASHKPALPVTIILCSFNGAEFIEDQLSSITRQTYPHWHLLISDDGSTDATLSLMEQHPTSKRALFRKGPRNGVSDNFLSALQDVPKGHYVAFCDQDDVWCSHKLSRAMQAFPSTKTPALYTADRKICDAELNLQGIQRRRKPVFPQQLLRNSCAGHTCVINPAAVELLTTRPFPKNLAFHDWWISLLILGHGGLALHDPAPTVTYRQHRNNVIGLRKARLRLLLNGTYGDWISTNLQALLTHRAALTPQALEQVEAVEAALGKPRSLRPAALRGIGTYSAAERWFAALI